ncbi:hypothetical protein H2202_007664 [Exophiala xenobiotica]|nr:hypothetical protein H2202_007664 [Exophiala xenobiotica]
MPGGKLHSPIWTPYALYGTVDYVYGWPAWDNHVGFSAAQALLNAFETVMYIYYLAIIIKSGADKYFTARSIDEFFVGSGEKTVSGPGVARAVLVLFSSAVMTLSKTVLYCNIGGAHTASMEPAKHACGVPERALEEGHSGRKVIDGSHA